MGHGRMLLRTMMVRACPRRGPKALQVADFSKLARIVLCSIHRRTAARIL
jgi:hypothetical protein